MGRQYLRMCCVRTFGTHKTVLGGGVTSFLTGRKSVFTPPYSNVEEALQNDVVHAFSKVLRQDIVVKLQM